METPERKPTHTRRIAIAVLAAAVLGLLALVWLDSRERIGATRDEMARRLRDIEADARDARTLARQSQEASREMQGKLALLEGKLADAQSQQAALEVLYQELSRNRDEWQLAEIEQVLAIAAQQLQLSGNVRAALLALQLAETRLARTDRPQFVAVRRALARDIERLKALPAVDLAALSRQLDALVAGVDALPLAFDARLERAEQKPKPAAVAAAPTDEPGVLARWATELWSEIRQLVVVRRVDKPEPPLLAPTQAYFLRENLRLRLLNARMALLARNQPAFQEDLRVAQQWLQRYFDARSRPAQAALTQLRQLQATPLSFEPAPSISDSLEAVRGFKSRRDRASG
jgi:uroporphyrin-3 C-methyltransferase